VLSISEFATKMQTRGGLAKSSRFVLRINNAGMPNHFLTVSPMATIFRPDLEFYCTSVNLPGKTFINEDIRRFGYGTIERRPTGMTFSEITTTFLVDNQGTQSRFFNSWMDYIYGISDGIRDSKTLQQMNGTPADVGFVFETAYPSTYLTNIDIFLLNENIEVTAQTDLSRAAVLHYQVIDAFPIVVGDMDLNWNNNNQLAAFSVTFGARAVIDNRIPESYRYAGTPYAHPNQAEIDSLITNAELKGATSATADRVNPRSPRGADPLNVFGPKTKRLDPSSPNS